MREGWEGARIRKDSQKYRANDPQRSAGRKACAMQDDTTALQISKGRPTGPHTVKGGTADCIGSSLTLPKSSLATLKTHENLWHHTFGHRHVTYSTGHCYMGNEKVFL